jgi:hypothetical protein
MAHLYNNYISVDTDFIPVFSETTDQRNPEKWKSFFPHDSFKHILNGCIQTLEMSSAESNKPLWLHGAYGTGKTFASFVLKHILEDDLDQVEKYFNQHQMSHLYTRLKAIRSKGNVLVVHRSSSAGIDSQNRLFNTIIESVKDTLTNNGYSYYGHNSQYDTVINTLKDPHSPFNFSNAFQKYRTNFDQYASPESVIRDLEELDKEDISDLLETIIEIADKENFNWRTSAGSLIKWVEDVIEINQLYAIVFIWDEFSEFFKNNQNNITGLQEIAMASPKTKFYPFIITHTGAEIITDQAARKILEARFKILSIDMAETTAFMLMGQVIRKNNDLKNEWEKCTEGLWARIERTTRRNLLNKVSTITERELVQLFPIHPYAAYLLMILSKDLSSNQRTMFQFLSGDYESEGSIKTNFRWFIDNHSNEHGKWNYLTVDYLWTYFFTIDNVDLDASAREAMTQYANYHSVCENEEHRRILRVALLLSTLQKRAGATHDVGQASLLRPTLQNIAFAFEGSPAESIVEQTMAKFVQKGIFGTLDEKGTTLYIPPAGAIDQDRWDKMREETLRQISFEKIIQDSVYAVSDQFSLTGYLQLRYAVIVITPSDVSTKLRDIKNLEANQIPLVVMFAKDENDRTKAKLAIDRIYSTNNPKTVVIDFSSQPLTEVDFNRFIDEKANEKYYSNNPNFQHQCNLAKNNAKNIIEEWKSKLLITTLYVYTSKDDSKPIQGMINLRNYLKEVNHHQFKYGLESITDNDKLFSATGYKETLAQMGMNKITIPATYAYARYISNRLTEDQIWNDPNYWKTRPEHMVSKLKQKIEEVIQQGFDTNKRAAITDIWEAIKCPPYGLLSCQGSAFLLGFLLKEYADTNYFKYDGANTVLLNYSDLSELIFNVVKGISKVQNQFIVKQTPEQIEFCQITGDIFGIPKEKRNSVDDIAKNISTLLTNTKIPLWSLKSFFEIECEDEDILEEAKKAINLYCEFVSTEQLAGRDRVTLANELYAIFKRNPHLQDLLKNSITPEHMKTGLEYYIAEQEPDLITLISRLHIQTGQMLDDLINRFSADSPYLWEKSDTDEQISKILIDYRFIDTVNKLLPETVVNINDARRSLDQRISHLKLPERYIVHQYPKLQNLFCWINGFLKNNMGDKSVAIDIIDANADQFNAFLNSQFETFSSVIRNDLGLQVSEEEVQDLLQGLEINTYTKPVDAFRLSINQQLDAIRRNRKINQLRNAWKQKTKTPDPETWSKNHRLPIICLFQNNNDAIFTFKLLNQSGDGQGISEELIDEAIGFIQSSAMDILDNEDQCNRIFCKNFAHQFAYIIEDIEDLKKEITFRVGDDPDKWMSTQKQHVSECVDMYCSQLYEKKYREKVKQKIQDMAPDKAKRYLIELVDGKPLVGISILKDQE